MTRQILCRSCGEARMKKPLDSEDLDRGWKIRFVYVAAQVPKGHGITMVTAGNRRFSPMADLVCDYCGAVITGQIVVAVSMWREGETFPNWEHQYGNELPPGAVAMADALTKDESSTKQKS